MLGPLDLATLDTCFYFCDFGLGGKDFIFPLLIILEPQYGSWPSATATVGEPKVLGTSDESRFMNDCLRSSKQMFTNLTSALTPALRAVATIAAEYNIYTVSYTHLTLPTIYSV